MAEPTAPLLLLTAIIASHSTTAPALDMDSILAIEQLVRDLKVDRDTWQAVALQFKAAFEAQAARLQELQDICFATQAELENERTQHHRVHSATALTESHSSPQLDDHGHSFGTAIFRSPVRPSTDCSRRPFHSSTNPLFGRVHERVDQKNFGCALTHVEQLLRGPLSSKARAESLLLRSIILRASGPEEIFDAFAVCSEAAELCYQVSELECFSPQIQNQRNSLYHELQMLHQSHDTFGIPYNHDHDHVLPHQASKFCNSEDDVPDQLRYTKRRSGFDESRTMEGLLVQLEEKPKEVRGIFLVLARCRPVLIGNL